MNRLDLPHDPLSAAIRARPAAPTTVVWVHRPTRGVWCVLRRATGGRTIYLCLDWTPGNEPVHILTGAADDHTPHNACPACLTELAAGTPAAEAVSDDTPAVSRAPTPQLRPAAKVDPVEAWDRWWSESRGDGQEPDRGDDEQEDAT